MMKIKLPTLFFSLCIVSLLVACKDGYGFSKEERDRRKGIAKVIGEYTYSTNLNTADQEKNNLFADLDLPSNLQPIDAAEFSSYSNNFTQRILLVKDTNLKDVPNEKILFLNYYNELKTFKTDYQYLYQNTIDNDSFWVEQQDVDGDTIADLVISNFLQNGQREILILSGPLAPEESQRNRSNPPYHVLAHFVREAFISVSVIDKPVLEISYNSDDDLTVTKEFYEYNPSSHNFSLARRTDQEISLLEEQTLAIDLDMAKKTLDKKSWQIPDTDRAMLYDFDEDLVYLIQGNEAASPFEIASFVQTGPSTVYMLLKNTFLNAIRNEITIQFSSEHKIYVSNYANREWSGFYNLQEN